VKLACVQAKKNVIGADISLGERYLLQWCGGIPYKSKKRKKAAYAKWVCAALLKKERNMLVKEVLKSALTFIDRADMIPVLDGEKATDEQQYVLNALLCCYNAVEDELARNGFPLLAEETVRTSGGKILYTALKHAPVRVVSAKRHGLRVPCQLFAEYVKVCADEAVLVYAYAPTEKTLEDTCELSAYVGNADLPAYGIAAEYCLMTGLTDEADGWQTKYNLAIEQAASAVTSATREKICARQWV
jgi:hypothetical protein